MKRPATAADPGDLEAFLAANPGIEFLDVYYTNLSGVPRGKRLRAQEFRAAYEDGRFLPGSIQVVDVTGLDVEESGLVWEDGDADRIGWPIAGTLARAPWLGADSAEVMLALHELDGRACDLDPRAILARVVKRFADDGLTPVVACELEFYLIDARRSADGGIALAAGADGRVPVQRQVYGLDAADLDGDFLRALWAACDALGLPTGAAIGEYGAGQYEVTLAHKPDALAAADDAVRFKRAAKGVAAARGRLATFMAKPFADRSGSGLHIHVSVNDDRGRNIFAGNGSAGSARLGHAIGGAALLMPASILVLAPLAVADDAVRFKRAAKGVAATRGQTATFMAKPFAELPGSGLHIHVSVNDDRGRNIFAAGDPAGSDRLGHAIGGAAQLMPASILVFAPNANSYRRFRRNGPAPARAGWGVNNRTVPLRIPAGPPASRHLEHRLAGADANPYLAVATVLAGIHHGLTHAIAPGPMVSGDGEAAGERLPTDWAHATALFEDSRLIADYWGARAARIYAQLKRVEQERFNAVVTALDYDWLLRSA